jgi:CBS domain-containing protein
MDTADISYRVADFLKKHPPFHAIEDEDLLALASHGRVRFHEANEYVLWQGEPHKTHIFVIQQGTVSLWDEAGDRAELRDVRGPGDMLGIERFNGARSVLHSARSASDVVIYAFGASDFEVLLDKYQHARRYVSAHGGVTVDYQPPGERRQPQDIFLHDVVQEKALPSCSSGVSVREAARRMRAAGADAIAVVDSSDNVRAVLTASWFLDWMADADGDVEQAIEGLLQTALPSLALNASVTDGVLTMGAANTPALALTEDGTPAGRLHAVVTARDLVAVFGDQPAPILQEIRRASSTEALRRLNHRARALALRHLTSAASVDWLARFTHLVDAAILGRVVALAGQEHLGACWCFCGSSGRAESLHLVQPQVVLIADDGERSGPAYQRVLDLLAECDYLPRPDEFDEFFGGHFCVADAREWKKRYSAWVRDPVRQEVYRARSLFDLRPVHGRQALWHEVAAALTDAVDHDFVTVLANDCLSNLPPLTFFQDLVVEESGERSAVFRLEKSALLPLVDVGRVFGMAAGKALGTSTHERFATARALLPEHESIFREAADTLSVVLWQQGRIGISQRSGGLELPPALLSRHDRQVLKSGFRSILRLIEFTADWKWIDTL